MLYKIINSLLKSKYLTWTDLIFELDLSEDFIDRTLSNNVTDSELQLIEDFFQENLKNVLNNINNSDTEIKILSTRENIRLMCKVVKKLTYETLRYNIIWVKQGNAEFFKRLLVTKVSGLFFSSIKNSLYTKSKQCTKVYCAIFNNSYWIIKESSREVILYYIQNDKVLSFNYNQRDLKRLLYIIDSFNEKGCGSEYIGFVEQDGRV